MAVYQHGREPRPAGEIRPAVPTVLFLFSDTGAGHRRAAEAVIEALQARYPGAVRTVLCDPLTGPAAARPLRWLAGLYGPCVRWAPWAWGAAYYISNSRPAMAVLWRTAFALAGRPAAAAAAATRPAVIVSCHPLTGRAAMQAAAGQAAAGQAAARQTAARPDRAWPVASPDPPGATGPVPVLAVVTDLAAVHTSWRHPRPDLLAVASAQARQRCEPGPASRAGRCVQTGLPVESRAQSGPLPAAALAVLRRSLGLGERDFVVLVSGGGEGCGGLARKTAAILWRFGDGQHRVHVVAACGRNYRLRQRLTAMSRRAGGRLTVLGFTGSFTDWLQCADVVVTKAGPGIIAEAACCGTPLLITSHLPGQERGNARLVLRAGAGRSARGVRALLRELALLRGNPAAVAAMRAGHLRLASPQAADQVAGLIAGLAGLPAAAAASPAAGRVQAARPDAPAESSATAGRTI